MTDKRGRKELIESARKPERGESRERWVSEVRNGESLEKQSSPSLENVCGFN